MRFFGIVYKIINNLNGKIYIGQTINTLKSRIKRHIRDNVRTVIHSAIIKYGIENFSYNTICYCTNKKQLNDKEKYYINKYKSLVNEHGYNLTHGGEGCMGYKHTEKTKKLLSKLHKGKTLTTKHKKQISLANKNRIMPSRTIEHTNKIIKAREGYKHTKTTLQKMSISASGRKNSMFRKKHTKETLAKMSKSLCGRKLSKSQIEKTAKSNNKSILQYGLDGKFIKEWQSAKIAGSVLKSDKTSITRCCRGGYKTSANFI